MSEKKLREKLPSKGYTKKIQFQLEKENKTSFSRTYISNVINGTNCKGIVYYNQDIIDAAIIVAREYQNAKSKQGKQIEKI